MSLALITEISSWCSENQIDCLYFLADSDHAETIRIAEDFGFRFVDIRETMELDLAKWRAISSPSSITIRKWEPPDLKNLQRISRSNLTSTRFFYDQCFSEELSASLYETWLTKSCQGYADIVLVAAIAGQIAGFITGHIDKDLSEGNIGLVAVDKDYRRRGVANALLNSLLDWFSRQNISKVNVVTQGRNISALRLYQNSNFLTEKVQLWYHKWFRDCLEIKIHGS